MRVAATPEAIRAAADVLRRGGLVAFPTETVYGLGADALQEAAVLRVFALKGRPRTSPLIVHVADEASAQRLAAVWPEPAARLAVAFWPGPLTLILPRAPGVPDAVTAGLTTVGLRVPAHPVARALLVAAGIPVAAPSANPFTRLSATRASDVLADFPAGIDVILDGGASAVGIESTVVCLAGPRPRLLRPGAVSEAALRAVVPDLDATPPVAPASGGHASPGLHARHYSPRTPLVVLPAGAALPAGPGAWVGRGAPRADAGRSEVLPADAAGFAARLYAALHDLDRLGLAWIAVEAPPPDADWDAVRDRLRRAEARG